MPFFVFQLGKKMRIWLTFPVISAGASQIGHIKLFASTKVKPQLLLPVMEKGSVFAEIYRWLKSSEMFARPVKQLPGKWQLFEYYRDAENGLEHVEEEKLKLLNENWVIEFFADEKFTHQKSLALPLFSSMVNGKWSLSKNYITFLHPTEFRNHIEFQFAVEKKILKLLKKDNFGKIDFFGFFKKLD